MARSWLATLDEVAAAGRAEWGGKAIQLARLRRLGYPGPEGLVIGAAAAAAHARAAPVAAALRDAWRYDEYPLGSRELYWDRARVAVRREPLPPALEFQLRAVTTALWPEGLPTLAVRSSGAVEDSAAASFAGIYRTELDVAGWDALLDAIRAVWSARWTPRAIDYCRRVGLDPRRAPLAAIIQRMVPAESAGVAFSIDPVTGAAQVVIDAVRGSGEGLVSGWQAPERYVLPREGGTPPAAVESRPEPGRDRTGTGDPPRAAPVPTSPVLSPSQAADLAAHVLAIERQFSGPQDVEWALAADRWWFLQTRPVTAAGGRAPAAGRAPAPRRRRLAGQKRRGEWPWGEHVWSNANVGEVLPGVLTPLTRSGIVATLNPGLVSQFSRMGGLSLPPDMPFVGEFDGRLYFNLAAIQWISWWGFGMTPAEANRTMGGNQPEIALPPATAWLRLGWGWRRLIAGATVAHSIRIAPARYRWVAAQTAAIGAGDLADDSDLALLDRLMRSVPVGTRLFEPFLDVSSATSASLELLRRRLGAWLPDAGPELLGRLLAGLGEITSAEHGQQLRQLAAVAREEPEAAAYLHALATDPSRTAANWRTALAGTRTLAGLEAFLARYGHRTFREMELASPRWSEDPAYLLRTAGGMMESAIADPAAARAPGRDAALAEARRLLRQRSPLLGRLRGTVLAALVALYARCARLREEGKSIFVRSGAETRRFVLEAGQRLVARGHLDTVQQVFYLERPEITGYLLGETRPETFRDLAARRQEEFARWSASEPPPVFTGSALPAAAVPRPLAPASRWRGDGVSAGRAEGIARVILSPYDGHRLREGDILVAPYADPAWTPLFLRARGLVLEIGGMLSHGAIVAREYGLPAVANLPGITRAIPDGVRLLVDGGTGEVERRDG
jgi:pyruvate,water dikinase